MNVSTEVAYEGTTDAGLGIHLQGTICWVLRASKGHLRPHITRSIVETYYRRPAIHALPETRPRYSTQGFIQ